MPINEIGIFSIPFTVAAKGDVSLLVGAATAFLICAVAIRILHRR